MASLSGRGDSDSGPRCTVSTGCTSHKVLTPIGALWDEALARTITPVVTSTDGTTTSARDGKGARARPTTRTIREVDTAWVPLLNANWRTCSTFRQIEGEACEAARGKRMEALSNSLARKIELSVRFVSISGGEGAWAAVWRSPFHQPWRAGRPARRRSVRRGVSVAGCPCRTGMDVARLGSARFPDSAYGAGRRRTRRRGRLRGSRPPGRQSQIAVGLSASRCSGASEGEAAGIGLHYSVTREGTSQAHDPGCRSAPRSPTSNAYSTLTASPRRIEPPCSTVA
jgi:hypothetical protein